MSKAVNPSPPAGAALLALLLALSACDPSASPPPTEEGIPRELARIRKATIDSLRYDVRLSVPARRDEPVTGVTTLRFHRNDPEGRAVVLDFLRPDERVHAVRVGGESVSARFPADHIVVPGETLPERGAVEIEVEFRAGDEALNRTDEFLYALFVPDRAHFSLPVVDQPDLKARFALTLEIPASWEAVANGGLLEEEVAGPDDGAARVGENAGGGPEGEEAPASERRRLRFARTEPLPTYLFAFAAGRFRMERAERAGRTMTFLHREPDSAKVARNLETIFDLHGTALEWLEDYTGIPYPFGKFGFVAVPSFQYGGMEHPGAIYYRASSLFLDESATQSQLLGRASVIAHETAHMWFGDLVTMEWFDDVWMKEVFANFMAARIVHPSFPDLNHELRFFLSHYPSAYGVDRTRGTHPIRQELENLNEAGTLYGAIIYQKAPIVMKQLELLIGEDTFREGLREYLDAHRYGNASWPDLIRVLDRRTGEDLRAWSRIWVEESGRPRLRARLRERDAGRIATLRIEQEDPRGAGRVWPQALSVVLGYGADSTVALPVRMLESAVLVDSAAGMPTPDFVLPGGKGAGYGLFLLDPPSRTWLLEGLPDIADPMIRGTGYVTLWDAVLEGDVEPERFLDLLVRGAGTEEVELNLQRVLGYLDATWWRLLDDDQRSRWAGRVEETLWEGVRSSGTRTVRAAYFRAFRSVALSEGAVERVRRIWSREEEVPGVPLSPRDYTALATELALREVDAPEEILDAQLERIENPDRRDRFRFVRPSLSADPAVRERFFRSLEDPEARARERWVADAVSYLHHPLRADHARRFVRPSLEMLEEIQRTGDIFFPGRWLEATLWGHTRAEVASTVRDFLAARPDYPRRLRNKVLQSADLLFRAAEIVHGGGEEADSVSVAGGLRVRSAASKPDG